MAMLEKLTDRIRGAAAGKPGFGKSIRLDLGESGAIRIDGAGETVAVDNDAAASADTTISMSAENLDKLMRGELNAMTAVAFGKIRIAGDMSQAMMLSKFLG